MEEDEVLRILREIGKETIPCPQHIVDSVRQSIMMQATLIEVTWTGDLKDFQKNSAIENTEEK